MAKQSARLALLTMILAILACRRATGSELRFYTPTPTAGPAATAYATRIVVVTATPGAVRLIGSGAWNCRIFPGGPIVAYASAGQAVTILAERGGWYRVDLAGTYCWIRREAVR